MVVRHGLILSTWYAGSVASQEVQPRSATTCVLPRATCFELQRDLQLPVACYGLGGAQERSRCEPRPAAASVWLGVT